MINKVYISEIIRSNLPISICFFPKIHRKCLLTSFIIPKRTNKNTKQAELKLEMEKQYLDVQADDKTQGLCQFQENTLFQEESPSYRSKSIDVKISNLNDQIIKQALRDRDYRSSISLLHQLESYIENQSNNCSRNNKLLYYYQLSICYYNHAVVYQKVQNDLETCKYFGKALKNFQNIQGYITNREEGLCYAIELAKLHLQYCSILSQNAKHQEAITHAEKSLQKLIQCFRVLQAICFQFKMANRLPETNSNSRDSRTKIQLVNFKQFVVFQAEKMLKQLCILPEPHQLVEKFKPRFQSLMQKMFFWKDNSENNQKLLRAELKTQRKQVSSQRNILGVQKSSNIHDYLTIEKLTNLQLKSIKYNFATDAFYLLSGPKLTEMSFYSSMIYFTLATEIRFSQTDLNVNKLKIDQKYQKLNRDQRMLKCKLIHMKAIEIAGKFLPENCDYFSHILSRFNKNYKCVMEEIGQQSKEQSLKEFAQQQKTIKQNVLGDLQSDYGLQNNFKNHTILNAFNGIQQNQQKDKSLPFKIKRKKNNFVYAQVYEEQLKHPTKFKRKKSTNKLNTKENQLSSHYKRQRSGSKNLVSPQQLRQRLRSTSYGIKKLQDLKPKEIKQSKPLQSSSKKHSSPNLLIYSKQRTTRSKSKTLKF